ncbi:MAG TPA: Hsp20/alpha crystallin family protein [Pyrinomonadaceae bacterium]|jgi:HSP20 family protein
MMTQRWDPLRDLVVLQERMNRLFEDASKQRSNDEEEGEQEIERADWSPAADVYNREHEYVIMIDLPGIEREALELSLDDNRLLVRGVRAVEQDAAQRIERKHGRFLRRFGPLPPTVDQSAITAEYKDGVLMIRLPKRQEQKAQRVEIKIQ